MNLFATRRWLGATTVVAVLVLAWLVHGRLTARLIQAEVVSGVILLGLLLFLAGFNARKRLPMLPLLRAATWMQLHVYGGLVAVGFFALHSGLRWPAGVIERWLAGVFITVAGSGIAGWWLSRRLPARITLHGDEVVFETIPAKRHALAVEAERLAVESVAATKSSTVADFYERRLRGYFAGPRHSVSHLLNPGRPLRGLLDELRALDRYLNQEERRLAARLTELVRAKDNLDFQRAAQGLLKLWLFVHVPLTGVLLLLAAVHGYLAWMFS